MTVNTTIGYQRTAGDGVTTVYAVDFALKEAAQLVVELVNRTTGAVTAQSLTTHYTLAIAADEQSAVLTMLAAVPATQWLVRRRKALYTQPNSLPAHGPFPSGLTEQALDRIVMDLQAIRDQGSRALRFSDSDPTTGNTLPPIDAMKGKFVYIDDAGNVIGTAGLGSVPVSPAMAPVVLAATTAAAYAQLIAGIDLMQVSVPRGRLTLQSGAAVMTANQTAKTLLYYTPYGGLGRAPIWNGSYFVATPFAEISNDLTQSASGKAGPAAAGPYQVIDAFVWNDAGTVRLTRGPKWKKSAAVTTTIASPAVLTWNGHGLYDGATYRWTDTTGALPTGFALNTDYFVTKIDANTFKLSSTLANQVAGSFINTSGSQSGVHTGENYTTARGTGAGSAELELLNGLWVNKYDITNGPAARMGTYVGCIVTDGSSQANWHLGGLGAGGTAALLGVWNAYNRVRVTGMVGDSTDSWPYATPTVRPANGSATARVWCLYGLQEDFFSAAYQALRNDGTPANEGFCGVLYNATAAFSGRLGYFGSTSVSLSGSGDHQAQHFGWGFMSAGERGNGTGTGTWYGDNGAPTIYQSGLRYECNC